MKIKLTAGDLSQIHDSARVLWLENNNIAVPVETWALCCQLQALSNFLYKQGIEFTVEVPKQVIVEPVED